VDERALTYLRTLVYAALLGVAASFAATLFQTALHDVIHLVWDVVPDRLGWSEPAGWYVVLVPALAGVVVALALRLPGHGGHSPLEGLGMGAVDPRDLSSILVAALATLGGGLVLGPEGPLIALGLGVGVVGARLVRADATDSQLLVLAGAFAAVAALFGGPLIAAFLIFELAAASGQIPPREMGRALLPGFVAAGTGALVFTGIGDWPGLHQASLELPGLAPYETVRVADLAWCLVLAFAAAGVVVLARRLAHVVAVPARRRPDAALVAAGLLVGALAVAFRALADRPVDYVLFSGQQQLPLVVAETSVGVLVLLVLAKGAAYALSLAAGFRGGPVFPAITLGAALGALAAEVLPGLATTPAVGIGIAAATAAVIRAPFTAVLLVTLLFGAASASEISPLAVLAAAVGWLVAIALPNPEDRASERAAAEATRADRPAPRPGGRPQDVRPGRSPAE
jgi:H+/Cl- antiporter ClcA